MDQITDIVLNQAFVGWVGLVGLPLAVVALVYQHISNERNKRHKEPYWAERSYALVLRSKDAAADLDVQYRGRPIERLSATEVLFWNNGGETINGVDIAVANPLRIQPYGDSEILEASVLATNSWSTPSIVVDGGVAIIGFDYLDKGQGIVFRLLHTGSAWEPPQVVGDIRGAQPKKRICTFYRELVLPTIPPPTRRERLMRFVNSIGYIFVLSPLVIYASVSAKFNPALIPFAVAVWLFTVGATLAFLIYLNLPKNRTIPQPDGFVIVEETKVVAPVSAAMEPSMTIVRSAETPTIRPSRSRPPRKSAS